MRYTKKIHPAPYIASHMHRVLRIFQRNSTSVEFTSDPDDFEDDDIDALFEESA